jgi:hypothetical protein
VRSVPLPGTESNHPQVVFVSANRPLPDLAGCKPAVRQTKCLRYGAREFVGSNSADVRTREAGTPLAVELLPSRGTRAGNRMTWFQSELAGGETARFRKQAGLTHHGTGGRLF